MSHPDQTGHSPRQYQAHPSHSWAESHYQPGLPWYLPWAYVDKRKTWNVHELDLSHCVILKVIPLGLAKLYPGCEGLDHVVLGLVNCENQVEFTMERLAGDGFYQWKLADMSFQAAPFVAETALNGQVTQCTNFWLERD